MESLIGLVFIISCMNTKAKVMKNVIKCWRDVYQSDKSVRFYTVTLYSTYYGSLTSLIIPV
jgi:hypothetical protein